MRAPTCDCPGKCGFIALVHQVAGVLLILSGWVIGAFGVAGIVGPAIALQRDEPADD